MLSSALGATIAIWLLLAPVLGLQSDPRSELAVVVGALALVLSPLATWKRAMRAPLAVLGLVLTVGDFVMPGSAGAIADFATCAVLLIIAGGAPHPEVVARIAPLVPIALQDVVIDQSETPTRRLIRAA